MRKERIDKLLVENGLAESVTKAQALVMAGVVLVDERRAEKPSDSFAVKSVIRLKGDTSESKYVGRGGLKLEAALREFKIDPTGFICLDIGASTGGFTDCLLQYGAKRVVAVDAGTNQLVWKLREDPRVDVREKTNARNLKPEHFDSLFDLIVIDVSFISVTKIIPVLSPLLSKNGRVVILIKPQFEVRKWEVGAGGIVIEPEKHQRVIAEVSEVAVNHGLVLAGLIDSPITGAAGNKEFLALYEKGRSEKGETPKLIEGLDYYFENGLMVLTAHFLKNRGYCCGNGCRHCPYPPDSPGNLNADGADQADSADPILFIRLIRSIRVQRVLQQKLVQFVVRLPARSERRFVHICFGRYEVDGRPGDLHEKFRRAANIFVFCHIKLHLRIVGKCTQRTAEDFTHSVILGPPNAVMHPLSITTCFHKIGIA